MITQNQRSESLLAVNACTDAEGADSSPQGHVAKIFLVDDHSLLREGLRTLIETQPDMCVCGETSNGQVAYQQLSTPSFPLPDLLLMDISMKGWNGSYTTQRIKSQWPKLKVLVFSMHEERSYLHQLLQAGISGYVLKSSPSNVVLKAIRSVLADGVYFDPKFGETILDLMRGAAPSAIPRITLSKREEFVLKQVSCGYSNKEIAAQLGISIKTVETHKARGMNKLALDSRVDLIRHALAQGWLQEETIA